MGIHNVGRAVVVATILGLQGLCGCADDPAASSAVSVAGTWATDCLPMSDAQAFKLDFEIGDPKWHVDYTVFADKACGAKFVTVAIDGEYEIGAASASVPGASDAKFGFARKTVTPHSDAAAQFLKSDAGCKLADAAVGVASDITAQGCAALGQYPHASCAADYDVVKVDGASLTFGARPADNDMCTPDKRPKALATISSHRR